MGPAQAQLTCDRFLGGRLKIWQPAGGYRAGADAVLLAAAVRARPQDEVLELGCGAGVASLCLAWRVGLKNPAAVELQEEYAELARRNARANGIGLQVSTADLAALPASLRGRSFDHVLANPPYFLPARSSPAPDPGRALARSGATPLAVWVDVATRRLRPGGSLTMIQHVERLDELLRALDSRLGSIAILPLAARAGREARRVILSARKGGRGRLRLLAPLILHAGAGHGADGDDYTPEVSAILRRGAPLNFPD